MKQKLKKSFLAVTGLIILTQLEAQTVHSSKPFVSKVWVADNGNGTYKNPIINSDYSDPDAVRVGDQGRRMKATIKINGCHRMG